MASKERQGVFVTRGGRLSFPAGSIRISIGDDGTSSMSIEEIHLTREMAPDWFEIALERLDAASREHNRVLEALESDDNDSLGAGLEGELRSSMQAIVASATGVDALYASAKEHVALPPSLVSRWRENGTARWRQVAEVFRRAFRTPTGSFAQQLRRALKEVYRFRDMAVHPSAETARVSLHPDLEQGTDWRFVAFSYDNAAQHLWVALMMSQRLLTWESAQEADTARGWREGLAAQLAPVFAEWESRYGDLRVNPFARTSA